MGLYRKDVDLRNNQTINGVKSFSQISEVLYTANITGGATIDLVNGRAQWLTLTGNITSITFSNTPATGVVTTLSLILQQDGTGGRTIVWPTVNFYWAENVEPPLATAISAINMVTIQIINNGGTLYYFASLSIRNAS